MSDPHASISQEDFIKALQHAINQPAYKTTEKKQMPVWAFFYKVGPRHLSGLRQNSVHLPSSHLSRYLNGTNIFSKLIHCFEYVRSSHRMPRIYAVSWALPVTWQQQSPVSSEPSTLNSWSLPAKWSSVEYNTYWRCGARHIMQVLSSGRLSL